MIKCGCVSELEISSLSVELTFFDHFRGRVGDTHEQHINTTHFILLCDGILFDVKYEISRKYAGKRQIKHISKREIIYYVVGEIKIEMREKKLFFSVFFFPVLSSAT